MTIKETRELKGLTQKELSNITGIPFRTIQNWENGISQPSPFTQSSIINRIEEYKTPQELEEQGKARAALVEKGRQVGYMYKNIYKDCEQYDKLKICRAKLVRCLADKKWSDLLNIILEMSNNINETTFFDNIFDCMEMLINGKEITEDLHFYILSFINALGDSVEND